MKKISISIICLLTTAWVSAMDANLELLSGDYNFIQDPALAEIKIDFSKAVVVEFGKKGKVDKLYGSVDEYNQIQGQDWVEDWPAVQKVACLWASKFFNKKGLQTISVSKEDAALMSADEIKKHKKLGNIIPAQDDVIKYTIALTIDTVDFGNASGTAFTSALIKEIAQTGGTIYIGSCVVTNNLTGEVVSNFNFDDCKGKGGPTQRNRVVNVLQEFFSAVMKASKAKK